MNEQASLSQLVHIREANYFYIMHNAKHNSIFPAVYIYLLVWTNSSSLQYHHSFQVTTAEQINKQQHHASIYSLDRLQGHSHNKVTIVACKFCTVCEIFTGMTQHTSDYLCLNWTDMTSSSLNPKLDLTILLSCLTIHTVLVLSRQKVLSSALLR